MTLKVNEIFYSIQGESSFAGLPCVFIRLTGCNLRCSYCDTQYAFSEGKELAIAEIISKVESYQCKLIEVTGGEPLIQKETPLLIENLLDNGFKVLLETNGSLDIGQVDKRCIKIVDFKCPSSGEQEKNNIENLSRLRNEDEVKFVIGNQEDYLFAKGIINQLPKEVKVHFSPVFHKINLQDLAKWILEDHLDVRLQLQLHKFIWDPSQRGV